VAKLVILTVSLEEAESAIRFLERVPVPTVPDSASSEVKPAAREMKNRIDGNKTTNPIRTVKDTIVTRR
jgi:hypothetical protein